MNQSIIINQSRIRSNRWHWCICRTVCSITARVDPSIHSAIHSVIGRSLGQWSSLNRSTSDQQQERERDARDTVPSGPQWFMPISFAQSIQWSEWDYVQTTIDWRW